MSDPDPLPPRPLVRLDDPMSWESSRVILRLTLYAVLIGATVTAVVMAVLAPQQLERLLGPALAALVAITGAVLSHQGRPVAAKVVLAYGMWSVFVGIAVFTGGARAAISVAFPIVILLCGWQIGARTAIFVAALTTVAVAAMVVADIKGQLPTRPYIPVLHGTVLVAVVVLSAVLIVFVARAYRNRLRELNLSGRELARRGAELEQSQDELHRAQAVASVGSWVFDLVHDRMHLSAETCRIFGLPEGTIGSHASYVARVHLGDRDLVEQAWAASFKGAAFDHEHRILVGRSVRWIRQKAELEFKPDGTPLRAVGITQDITERKQADDRIAELAFHDQLSGLPNRTLLLDRLKQVMVTSERDASYSALVFLDLDNFKTLNDTLGHDMGDLLLQQVANRLMGCVRAGDTVARLGGDEFVVMLAGLGTVEAAAVIAAETVGEKVLDALNQPYQIGSHDYRSTPSIGITLFGGGRLESIEEPLKRADLAMYQSKAAGRNTLRFFDPKMQAAVTDRAALETGLRAALVREEFVLHFQPLVTGAGQVTGAEALVRWQHPVRGLVSPAEFISLAEETGLILALGQSVMEQACAQLAAWAKQATLASLTMAVNVSARQFRQPDFVEQVLAVIARSGANPQRLKLELTESLLVANVEDIIAKMTALKAHGIGFALDDFGTGYSSLSYLSRLPLDELKIDRSFVMGIETSEHAVAICAATISLAHSLGLKVVAEGVETAAQRDLLHHGHGCDYLQGYLFSRPLALEQFEAFARSR